ncbi:MAG: hypothetical protein LBL13_13140 [Bacteroidales bacterium]|jgi:hypothetical protein|nr:hypothetical protein [Bacteroidales bacterium]
MKSILNNPYRIAGLLVGASAKETKAKIKKFRVYVEAGETPPANNDDYSFPVLGKLSVTRELLSETESKLDLDSDKMEAALFWFYNANFKDEAAIEYLKNKNTKEALEIWEKSTSSGLISVNNWSAFHNLSTLYLWKTASATRTSTTIATDLEKGISLKMKFLESKFAREFVSMVTDKTYSIKPIDLEKMFLQTVKRNIEQDKITTPTVMATILAKLNFEARDEFLKGFVQTFVSEIERQVEATAQKRKADPSKAADAGIQLFLDVDSRLEQLKEMRGEDLQYTSIADKVANELLQCAIDSYNDFHSGLGKFLSGLKEMMDRDTVSTVDNAYEFLNEAKPLLLKLKNATKSSSYSSSIIEDLFRQGQSIAVGKIVKNRYDENAGITQSLDAKDIYIKISTRIASDAEQMCIAHVNASSSDHDLGGISKLKKVITTALEVYGMIDKMDLTPEYRRELNGRKNQLSDLSDKLPSSYDLDRAIQYKWQEEKKKERAAKLANRIYVVCAILGVITGLIFTINGGVGKIIGGLVLGFFGGFFAGWIVSAIVVSNK